MEPAARVRVEFAVATHPGTHRTENQDRVAAQSRILDEGAESGVVDAPFSAFVADGVGGRPAGATAAELALNVIVAEQSRSVPAAFLRANEAVLQVAASDDAKQGMASVAAGFLIAADGSVQIAAAGDAAVWALRNDLFFQATTPHVLNELIDDSPVTSYFGVEPDSFEVDAPDEPHHLDVGDVLLACSDGLFKSLSQADVRLVLTNSSPVEEQVSFLLEKALAAGAPDNVSLAVVRRLPDPSP